jgi:hypothetical protein
MIADRPGFTPWKTEAQKHAMETAAGGSLGGGQLSEPSFGTVDHWVFLPSPETARECPAYEAYLTARWGAPQTMRTAQVDDIPPATFRVWLDEQTHTRMTLRLSEENWTCWLSQDRYISVADFLRRIPFGKLGKPLRELWPALPGGEPQNNGPGWFVRDLGIAWSDGMTTTRYLAADGDLDSIHIEASIAKKTYEMLVDELASVHLVKPRLSYDEATSEFRLDVSAPDQQ